MMHPCSESSSVAIPTLSSAMTCPVSDVTSRTCASPAEQALSVTDMGATALSVVVAVDVAVEVVVVAMLAVEVAVPVSHPSPSGTR